MLDSGLPLGVVGLDPLGEVISRNHAARLILDEGEGIRLEERRLVATLPEEANDLHRLVHGACASTREPRDAGGTIAISRSAPRRPMTLFVAPLRWPTLREPRATPAALVLIDDPDREPARLENVLGRLYGLTQSERDVTLLVLDGADAEEIARQRGTSLNTARTHIKRILSKVGVQSKVELVRRLLAGPFPAATARAEDPGDEGRSRHIGRLARGARAVASGARRLLLAAIAVLLPVFGALAADAAQVESEAAYASRETSRYERSVASYTVPDVMLVDQDGRQVSLASLLASGSGIALNFVFTTCNAVCPVMTATFSRMRSELGPDANGLRFVSISIDPEHDTPAVLKRYASRFESGRDWAFLTGDPGQVLRVQKAFGVFTGAKTEHQAVTFFRGAGQDEWVRIKGFASAAELAGEYRRLRAN